MLTLVLLGGAAWLAFSMMFSLWVSFRWDESGASGFLLANVVFWLPITICYDWNF